MEGLTHELDSVGIKWKGSYHDNENLNDLAECEHIHPDETISAVVIGMDLNINYKKLAKAYTYLQNHKTHYIATNGDLTYPCKGTTFPGTGSLVSSLTASSGRQPVFVGKPNQTMMDVIVDKFKLDRTRTIMVSYNNIDNNNRSAIELTLIFSLESKEAARRYAYLQGLRKQLIYMLRT